MSRRRTTSSRRAERRKRQTRTRNILLGVGGFILLGIIGLVVAGGSGAAAASVPQERLELDPYLGNPDAPVTLVEYGAYACSACRSYHNAGIVEQILAEYPDQVNFTFRDYPVISPVYDLMAAEVAQCVLDQDQELFWAFHDALYTVLGPGDSSEELMAYAEQLGADGEALSACVASHTHRQTVQYDDSRARQLGLRGTPSFLVNGQLVSGSLDAIRAAIDVALGS